MTSEDLLARLENEALWAERNGMRPMTRALRGAIACITTLEAELAKCGREHCMGQDVEGHTRWVTKAALTKVEAELDELKVRLAMAREAIKRAENWFRDYALQHRRKGTTEGNLKAATNEERADYLRSARQPKETGE